MRREMTNDQIPMTNDKIVTIRRRAIYKRPPYCSLGLGHWSFAYCHSFSTVSVRSRIAVPKSFPCVSIRRLRLAPPARAS